MNKNRSRESSFREPSEDCQNDDLRYRQGIRQELGYELRRILISTALKQRELAVLLDVRQPEVSHLLNGNFSRFTIDKLAQFFYRLGWALKFEVYQRSSD